MNKTDVKISVAWHKIHINLNQRAKRPPAVIWCLRRCMCVMDSPASLALRTSLCCHGQATGYGAYIMLLLQAVLCIACRGVIRLFSTVNPQCYVFRGLTTPATLVWVQMTVEWASWRHLRSLPEHSSTLLTASAAINRCFHLHGSHCTPISLADFFYRT